MKRRGPPSGGGPGAEKKLREAGQRSHTRSDPGHATPTSSTSSPAPTLEQPSLTAEHHQAAALRIVIEATKSGRKWTARLGDRVLCSAAAPFVVSARLLLA